MLNKLVDQYNNTYHSIDKKPIDANYSALTENIDTNSKVLKFNVNGTVRITKYKNIFSKDCTDNSSREILLIMFWKPILGHIKLKISTEKK